MNPLHLPKAARVGILALALTVAPLTAVSMAQSTGGTTNGAMAADNTRTESRSFDWGWLGLLGLLGLTALGRRGDRNRVSTTNS